MYNKHILQTNPKFQPQVMEVLCTESFSLKLRLQMTMCHNAHQTPPQFLRHRIAYNSQFFIQVQSCIRLARHNSGYSCKVQILFTKCTEAIHSASNASATILFTQHSDITGLQMQELTHLLHLIHLTSGTKFSGPHDNLLLFPDIRSCSAD
jgi:hypothetical protein